MEMYDILLNKFLAEQPWNNQDIWIQPKSLTKTVKTTLDNGVAHKYKAATGFVDVNLRIKESLVKRVKATAYNADKSIVAVIYSAFYWWLFTKNHSKFETC
jgi:hypothetical protein